MFAVTKETSRKPASGLKETFVKDFILESSKDPRGRVRTRGRKRRAQRDEGKEEAGQPCLAEMSQERTTNAGSSSLITEKMSVKGWCNEGQKFMDL